MSSLDIRLREVLLVGVSVDGGETVNYSGDLFENGLMLKIDNGSTFKAASGKISEIDEKVTITGSLVTDNAAIAAPFAAYDGKNVDITVQFIPEEYLNIIQSKMILSVKKIFTAGQLIKYNFSGELSASKAEEILAYA
jgi:hypothetical protein